jgi:hypothetical protein
MNEVASDAPTRRGLASKDVRSRGRSAANRPRWSKATTTTPCHSRRRPQRPRRPRKGREEPFCQCALKECASTQAIGLVFERAPLPSSHSRERQVAHSRFPPAQCTKQEGESRNSYHHPTRLLTLAVPRRHCLLLRKQSAARCVFCLPPRRCHRGTVLDLSAEQSRAEEAREKATEAHREREETGVLSTLLCSLGAALSCRFVHRRRGQSPRIAAVRIFPNPTPADSRREGGHEANERNNSTTDRHTVWCSWPLRRFSSECALCVVRLAHRAGVENLGVCPPPTPRRRRASGVLSLLSS